MEGNIEKYQRTSSVVDVADWPSDERGYREGSRPKDTIFCPRSEKRQYLIPNHRYILKQSRDVYPEQFWCEIIAYKIGLLTGINVPPAFCAINSELSTCGALIEWFYDYPDEIPSRYISAEQYFVRLIKGFDVKRGKQHNLRTAEQILKRLGLFTKTRKSLSADFLKMFLFDALIGNSDRHQNNWGVLWLGDGSKRLKVKLAPVFDNGTSMANEILEENFFKFDDDAYLKRYINRGTHHMKWSTKNLSKIGHFQFFEAMRLSKKGLLYLKPFQKELIKCLSFNDSLLFDELMRLTKFEVPVPLSEARVALITKLVLARKERLLRIVG